MKSKSILGLLACLAGLIIFAFGFCYGARVGALGEMSAFEILFAENLGVLDKCRKGECDVQVRDLVASMNEVALSNYTSLETLQHSNWFASNFGFGLRGLAIGSTTPVTRSSEEWRSMFKK